MKVLLVAATKFESQPIRLALNWPEMVTEDRFPIRMGCLEIGLLHTGIGMVNTAFQLGLYFGQSKPDVAVQFGIAGAFLGGPSIGDVVEVVSECYPELGADSPAGPLTLKEMGFAHFTVDDRSYEDVLLQPRSGLQGLVGVRGVTVQRVSGTQIGIDAMVDRHGPEVETMEGAAFFQASLLAGVPFRQLRGISNLVEPRNRAHWRMKEAIEAVNQTLLDLLVQASDQKLVL